MTQRSRGSGAGKLVLQGKMNRKIAEGLQIGTHTVKHNVASLMQNLAAGNRLEVVLAAGRPVAAVSGASA